MVTVSTTGDTTSLTWSIASGNDDGVFAIGASTGAITVADTTNLDYETTTSYDLVVQATDGTTPDTETITITLKNVNDNAPVYSLVLLHNLSKNSMKAQVLAWTQSP